MVRVKVAGMLCGAMLVMVSTAGDSRAAMIRIDEDAHIDVGFLIQPMAVVTESDLDGDGTLDSETEFKVRRGRLRLRGVVGDRITAFLQSDLGTTAGGAGYDWRIIDAWVMLRATDELFLLAGQNMAPANRQNMTAASVLLTIDRPGLTYKSLTWGTRALSAFSNRTLDDTDAGLRGPAEVRDLGLTLFAVRSFTDGVHGKAYLGAYEGVQLAGRDAPRLTGRLQLNFGDAEPGYYNLSTYLGGKRTVGIGASYDTQASVADSEDRGAIDYTYYSLDIFAEHPWMDGHVTLEAAFSGLDLDGATALYTTRGETGAGRDATRAEGAGYYVQAGYYQNRWQPWAGFERWNSDAEDETGAYSAWRVGLSYYLRNHNAVIKGGYERLKSVMPLPGTNDDTIGSFVMKCSVTY